jgi:hypothetical protein
MESAAFRDSMENLRYLIETSVEFMADLIELIPGYGQAFAVARMVGQVLAFISGPKFDELLDALTKVPKQIHAFLTQDLDALLSSEGLWDYFLYGGSAFRRIKPRANASPKPARRRRPTGPFARIGEIARSMWAAVRRFVGAFGRVKQRISAKFLGFRSFVLTRPRLAAALRFLSDLLLGIRAVPNPASLAQRFREMQAQFTERLSGMLQELQNFRLPTRLVPMEHVIQIVLSIILRLIPGFKGKVFTRALRFVGGDVLIARAIESRMAGTKADPNVHWQRIFLPQIQRRVGEIRDDLVRRLYGFLNRVPYLRGMIRQPRLEPVTIKGEEGFPAASPLLADRLPSISLPARLEPPNGGSALPRPVRLSVEARFGHDFGHVRLHTGSDASAPTAAFVAEGLTTGSHVYLRPGLSPAFGRGAQVLDHELAHVLQQTGPRDLGAKHPQRPQVGEPGRGLRLNRIEETQADRVARDARFSSTGKPIPVIPSRNDGIQPSSKVLVKLLSELSSIRRAERLRMGIETAIAKGRGPRDLDPEVRNLALSIWDHIRREIGPASTSRKVTFNDFLFTKKREIRTYLRNQHDKAIREAVPFLARKCQVAEQPKAKTKAKRSPAEVSHRLDVDAFLRLLEAHILVRSGVGLRARVDVDGNTKRVAVRGLRIYYLYLVKVGGTSPLWKDVIANTWSKPQGDEANKIRRKARQLLAVLGVSSGIWPRKGRTYIFGSDFKKDVDELVKGVKLEPGNLVKWQEYKKAKGAADPKLGHIGLRLGAHGTGRSDAGGQKGNDRESHHTTQYLLGEYFINKKGQKPFVSGRAYPGLEWAGGSPSTFKSPRPGRKDVQIATIEESDGIGQRGGRMPAILLSATTHRLRSLHVTSEAVDRGTGKRTQGHAIHNQFRGHLKHKELKPEANESAFREYKNKKPQNDHQEIQREIYTAMQKTYRWMRKHMMTALKTDFPHAEYDYYRDLALERQGLKRDQESQLHAEYRPSLSQLKAVAKEAESRNDQEMEKYGWYGS